MKLIRPSSLGHFDERSKRHAIYSLDFQPNAGRLATGASDNCVKLWDIEELLDQEAATGADDGEITSQTALLATLSNHFKSVNVVRWSTNGEFLASGSDDCYILIYKHTPGSISTSSFGAGSSTSKNKESWSRCATLQGHSMDILDLDWSPRGFLASASIDNTIMIWECKNLGQPGSQAMHNPLHVLRAHDNYVKGISFDPLGKYLVSSGSDNIVNIWDTDTWEVAEKLTEPMRNTMDRACSLFRRLSWSPDGQSFNVSACTKSNRSVGMLIKRGSWDPAIDLVGHEQPTLSTRFCPYVMQTTPSGHGSSSSNGEGGSAEEKSPEGEPSRKKNRVMPLCVVAMGDALGVLSVWTTGSAQAVLVLRDAFEGKNRAVTDLSWRRDGNSTLLACCSMDGSVIMIDFEQGFGSRMEGAALDRHFRRFYGKGHEEAMTEEAPLIADPMAFQYMTSADKIAAGAGTTSPLPLSPKKRQSTSLNSSHDGVDAPGQLVTIPGAEQLKTLQRQSQGKGGKKRIQPVMIQTSDGAPVAVAGSSNVSSDISRNSGTDGSAPSREKRARQDEFTGTTVTSNSSGGRISVGRPALTISYRQDEVLCTAPVHSLARNSSLQSVVKVSKAVSEGGQVAALRVLRAEIGTKPSSLSKGLRDVGGAITIVRYSQADHQQRVLEGSSSSGSTGGSDSLKEDWATPISGQVTALVGVAFAQTSGEQIAGDGVCVVGTADGTLHMLSLASGIRLGPPLVLGTAVTHVDARSISSNINAPVIVLAVTAEGELWQWKIEWTGTSGRLIRCTLRASVRSAVVSMRTRAKQTVVTREGNTNDIGGYDMSTTSVDVQVDRVFLNERCQPILFLSSRGALGGDWQAFCYDIDCQCWMRVADLRHLLSRAFNVTPVTVNLPGSGGGDSAADLSSLEATAAREGGVTNREILGITAAATSVGTSRSSEANLVKDWMALSTLCHLEDRVSVAFAVGSREETMSWLQEWIIFCCRCGQHERVRWVFSRLLARESNKPSQGIDSYYITWQWMDNVDDPKRIIEEVILPAVGKAGSGASDLLAELAGSLEAHELMDS